MAGARMNRQTYKALLPSGQLVGIISGTLSLDDTNSIYAQAEIVIADPGVFFDPRSFGNVQPPRVTIYMTQEFQDSRHISDLTAAGTGKKVSDLTAAGAGKKVSDLTAAALLETWNTGNDWAGRAPITRIADLALTQMTNSGLGTATLTLASDETYAAGSAGTQLATWAAAGINRLSSLVTAALAAVMTVVKLTITTDFDLTAAIAASPAQPVYTDDTASGLQTYIDLASARLYCSERRHWHLQPNTLSTPQVPIYTEGFEAGVGGWVATAPATAAQNVAYSHSGSHSLAVSTLGATAPTAVIKRTITGLIPGQAVTVSVWATGDAGNGAIYTSSITVTGSTLRGPSVNVIGTGAWVQLVGSFKATATSHEVVLTSTYAGGGPGNVQMYWDDVEVDAAPVDLNIKYGDTITQFTHALSRDTDFYDQVKIVYSWTDATGKLVTQQDFVTGTAAGVPGEQVIVTRDNTPYPGAGAALAMFNRTAAYGHEISVTAITDLSADPRQNLVLDLPDAPYYGALGAVTFDFAAKTMTITARNLR